MSPTMLDISALTDLPIFGDEPLGSLCLQLLNSRSQKVRTRLTVCLYPPTWVLMVRPFPKRSTSAFWPFGFAGISSVLVLFRLLMNTLILLLFCLTAQFWIFLPLSLPFYIVACMNLLPISLLCHSALCGYCNCGSICTFLICALETIPLVEWIDQCPSQLLFRVCPDWQL